MRRLPILIALVALLALAGCGGDDSSTESTPESTESTVKKSQPNAEKTKPQVTVPNGPPPQQLESVEIEEGSGAMAKAGDTVSVQYVGVGYKSGEEFDASWDRGQPFTFQLGAGMVIRGWDLGVVGMKVGGRRELIIPPGLAYGEGGTGSIGPNETLIFVIDLLAIE